MSIIEVGRICVKTRGREAGKKCVIVDIIDENYVLVTGPKDVNGVKRRRVNILHIEPTDKKININKGASDEDVKRAIQEAGLTDYMKETIKPRISVI
ncbi:50S ribosomal protein L14e [Stygiolobus azoricus]|uniref:Large ribosomal subunit protein eL14 n=1 Tax=Stygiolobus azoricus TaxID=41675 RepID=A0A650CMF8_9CREN|nr:50S ribosomal protein L14e [Stygiolobus azoricus]QGR18953.1 50S ribosomal protein L14e [Stygiolobus azoricus]